MFCQSSTIDARELLEGANKALHVPQAHGKLADPVTNATNVRTHHV